MLSSTFHLDSEEVYRCASQFRQQSALLHQQSQSLAILARSVDWFGPSRDMFQDELERIAVLLDRMADEQSRLSARLQATIEQWCGLDQQYEHLYSQMKLRFHPD